MKLPDDSPFVILDCNMYGKRVGVRLTEDFVEWLVRDCAKAAREFDGSHCINPRAALEYEILSRYGLEPQ